MARTFRYYRPHVKTGWHRFNWGIKVPPYPVVHISACEAYVDTEPTLFGDLESIFPVKGDATIFVANVVTTVNSDGTLGVDCYTIVSGNDPLNVCYDLTVFDPPEGGLIDK